MTKLKIAIASAAMLLAAGGVVLSPGIGWASVPSVQPGGVTSTNPADGVALTEAPTELELTFSAPPDLERSHVSARDGAGTEVGSGTLSSAGPDGLRLPLSIKAIGDYLIAYHVEFTDGTDAVGSLRFSVGTGVAPAISDAAAQRAADEVVSQHNHDIDPLSASLLVVNAIVLLGVVLLLLRRPRPAPLDSDQPLH